MKKTALILVAFLFHLNALPQQESSEQHSDISEQQFENLAEQQNGEPDDDSYLQSNAYLSRNKLNLNTADENDLKQLQISDLQIDNFLKYRKLLGPLVNIYELQAIPAWDVQLIERVLPFIKVNDAMSLTASLKQRLTAGQHSMLLRSQEILEPGNGFNHADSLANVYMGSRAKVFFRYKYMFQNLFQFGITGDKDAGEQFLKGSQKQGFDFYSFHLFARKIGIVKLLAIGDFTVNLGQGLTHWQSLAFNKNSDITLIKRQAEILRPYNSSGEYNFMRGAGITLGFSHFDFTAFGSVRKLDGNINADTSFTEDLISSILSSGYHRTVNEISRKNAFTQSSAGGNISYNKPGFHIGVSGIGFKFSSPLIRNISSYNQYAIQGKNWSNYSADYSFTYRNFHFFGETAIDKNISKAIISGLLVSLDEKVDASLLYRNIEKSYQTLYGNAFTENTLPTNEKGLFTGIAIKPNSFFKVEAYADLFSFPWLKYRVDAPSSGSDYLVQISYKPTKQLECYARFKDDNKAINLSGTDLPLRPLYMPSKRSWRMHISHTISRSLSLHQRTELLWFHGNEKENDEQGFLTYIEGKYKFKHKPVSVNGRFQYFETEGFNSRIYAYESDVLYSYSIPEFIGKGLRYYLNVNFDCAKKLSVWCRWAEVIYSNQNSIGSGLDKILGNKKSEIKLQALYNF